MDQAWIGGEPVRLGAAIAEAARLLGASRLPIIAGLGTDIAGARAAVALADRIGGVVDHMHSDATLRDLAVMREAGAFVTTAHEARLLQAPLSAEIERRIFWLCPGKQAAMPAAITAIGRTAELPAQLAVL